MSNSKMNAEFRRRLKSDEEKQEENIKHAQEVRRKMAMHKYGGLRKDETKGKDREDGR